MFFLLMSKRSCDKVRSGRCRVVSSRPHHGRFDHRRGCFSNDDGWGKPLVRDCSIFGLVNPNSRSSMRTCIVRDQARTVDVHSSLSLLALVIHRMVITGRRRGDGDSHFPAKPSIVFRKDRRQRHFARKSEFHARVKKASKRHLGRRSKIVLLLRVVHGARELLLGRGLLRGARRETPRRGEALRVRHLFAALLTCATQRRGSWSSRWRGTLWYPRGRRHFERGRLGPGKWSFKSTRTRGYSC
mmetsp:Transcript_10043/g.22165  ORF Transcript_10043/g.22165 Transcript_10043/m.22165 type:complete len:243 (-) Transcript_10043:1161-1889(-)